MGDQTVENIAIARAIGEVKGTLESLMSQTQQNCTSMNRRIDDLTHAVNQRIDDHQNANTQRFVSIEDSLKAHQVSLDSHKHNGKKALGGGGIAGAISAVSIELIKRLTEGG